VDAPASSKEDKAHPYGVNPDDPIIAPSLVPWKAYKNAHYEKRGFTLAGKDWHQWEDLPEGPLKYAGVKVRTLLTHIYPALAR
jgi:hypothetical protein